MRATRETQFLQAPMTTAPQIWSEPVTIHSYDVDFTRRATLEALCRCFLEAAWNHAEALGFGYGHLAEHNKLWVLSRLLVEFEALPLWGQKITLNTWPRGAKTIFALRDFEFLGPAGTRLAGGSSAWLILDAQSRRPQRVNSFLSRITPVSRQATGRDPDKITGFEPREHFTQQQSPAAQASAAVMPSASPNTELGRSAPWSVRYSDVDLNGHANSARYIGWLADAYDAGWHREHAPRQLEINYLGESREADTLSLRTSQVAPQEFLHGIFKANGQEACLARICWESPRS